MAIVRQKKLASTDNVSILVVVVLELFAKFVTIIQSANAQLAQLATL